MTGYKFSTFWLAQFFCAINGYEATGQKVFYKQTADFSIGVLHVRCGNHRLKSFVQVQLNLCQNISRGIEKPDLIAFQGGVTCTHILIALFFNFYPTVIIPNYLKIIIVPILNQRHQYSVYKLAFKLHFQSLQKNDMSIFIYVIHTYEIKIPMHNTIII